MNSKNARAPLVLGLIVTEWYRKDHRDLPWRKSADPYHVFLSEIMLQQTRVETVIEYYNRFLERFPNISELSKASTEEVMNLWKGLGYYRRAQNLHNAAKKIQVEYNGIFPDHWLEIIGLPGVGEYTAGAIMSIAFHKPYPAVDGNVLRVISRLYHIDDDIMKQKTKNKVIEIVQHMIPENRASDFCQGMMELGATLCKLNPDCRNCPLVEFCIGFLSGDETDLPIKKKKSKPVLSIQHVFLVKNQEDKTLVVYRKKGLLGGLWGLPHYDAEDDLPDMDRLGSLLQDIRTSSQIATDYTKDDPDDAKCILRDDAIEYNTLVCTKVGEIEHIFTHRKWDMKVWKVELNKHELCDLYSNDYQWLTDIELQGIPIPEAFIKVFRIAGYGSFLKPEKVSSQ